MIRESQGKSKRGLLLDFDEFFNAFMTFILDFPLFFFSLSLFLSFILSFFLSLLLLFLSPKYTSFYISCHFLCYYLSLIISFLFILCLWWSFFLSVSVSFFPITHQTLIPSCLSVNPFLGFSPSFHTRLRRRLWSFQRTEFINIAFITKTEHFLFVIKNPFFSKRTNNVKLTIQYWTN